MIFPLSYSLSYPTYSPRNSSTSLRLEKKVSETHEAGKAPRQRKRDPAGTVAEIVLPTEKIISAGKITVFQMIILCISLYDIYIYIYVYT